MTSTLLDEGGSALLDESGAALTQELPFPLAPLGQTCEIDVNGTWTDITGYTLHGAMGSGSGRPAVTITWGRADEMTTSPTPAKATWKADNTAGRFTARNPTGPWYPYLRRSTPVRWSVPHTGTFLRLEQDAVSCASCPDSAGVSITGDLELQIDCEPTSYAGCVLASKWDSTGSEQSWVLLLNADGTVTLQWSPDGTYASAVGAPSTQAIPLGRVAIKATLATASGTVTYYTASSIGGTWTQLGDAVISGAAAVFDSTTAITVGCNATKAAISGTLGAFGAAAGTAWAPAASTGFQGRIFEFRLYNGIGGTLEADAVFTAQSPGATSWTDAQSNTWTLTGTAEISTRDYRFHGEMSSLPTQWDPTGHDVWSQLTASGPLRRLSQGTQPPIGSAMTRGWQRVTGDYAPVAYWPMEDKSKATQIASGLPGGAPMVISGSPNLAADSSFPGSAAIPTLNKGHFSADIPPYSFPVPTAPADVVRFQLKVPSGGDTAGGIIARILTAGTVARMDLAYQSGGALSLTGYSASGTQLFASGNVAFAINGVACYAEVALTKNGTAADWHINVLNLGATQQLGLSATVGSVTVDRVVDVILNPKGELSGTAVGQCTVQAAYDGLGLQNGVVAGPFQAWMGETAGLRFARLCGEQGTAARVYGFPAVSAAMGYQQVDTFVNLLQACEDADRGQQFEPRTALALGYRTLSSMCSQSAAVTLDYSAAQVSPPLQPIDDDQHTVNDVTVQNVDGSSARVTLDDGTAMAIGTIGEYANSYSLNLAADLQAQDQAGWILHIGTVDEERYPAVTVNLADTSMSALAPDVRGVGVGDYVAISNPPSFLPPGSIKQLTWGGSEQLGDFCQVIAWNTVPESPYEVGIVGDDTYGRIDTDGSTLAAAAGGGVLPSKWSFEGGTDGWGASYATIAQSPAWAADGSHSLLITADGTGTSYWQAYSPMVACSPGDVVAVTAAVKALAALGAVKLSLHFGGSSDTYIGGTPAALAAGQDTMLLVSGTAPAGTTYWRIAVADAEASPAGTQMLADLVVGAKQDTMSVVTAAGNWIWTTDPADFPFDVIMGGEQITVTAISGSSSPQTFTITRSVNGVVKAHSAGEDIRLAQPTIIALA